MAPKILLIQLRQLGDILLSTPCIREIKRAWPDATIDFLCHPMGRLVLADNPYLSNLITYDPKGSWLAEWQLLRRLRRARYDIALDFMFNPRSALYARLSGAKRRLAFHSRRDAFFTEIVPQNPEVEYLVTEKFRYLKQLGIEGRSQQLDLPWSERDAAPVKAWINQNPSFAKAPFRVVLSPTSRRTERQWPLSHFARLADRLTREWGASVLWIWGPGEEEVIREVQSLCKESTLKSPPTSFRELAALIAQCDLYVGNTNGPSHVAVAVDTPSVQLHGPTYGRTWVPYTERHRAVTAGKDARDTRGPISLISEEEVWQSLSSMRPLVANDRQNRRASRSAWAGPVNFDIEVPGP